MSTGYMRFMDVQTSHDPRATSVILAGKCPKKGASWTPSVLGPSRHPALASSLTEYPKVSSYFRGVTPKIAAMRGSRMTTNQKGSWTSATVFCKSSRYMSACPCAHCEDNVHYNDRCASCCIQPSIYVKGLFEQSHSLIVFLHSVEAH